MGSFFLDEREWVHLSLMKKDGFTFPLMKKDGFTLPLMKN